MNEPTRQAQLDAANAYETLMVPALFGDWCSKVAEAARIRPGHRVLDVATGTGALARDAASRVGPGGAVTGLDPNPGMLDVARRLAPALEWRQGVAESLPFPDHSFDVVLSQFGLMFFRDRGAAVREAIRVLVRGGRFAFLVWDALENIPAYAAEVALLKRLAGPRAADALRAPFALGTRHALETLLPEAGVAAAEVLTDRGTARFPSARVMVEADLRGWLPVMGVDLPEDRIARILEEAEHVFRPYVAANGAVEFATSAHILVGSRA